MKRKLFNSLRSKNKKPAGFSNKVEHSRGVILVSFKDEGDEPAQVMIYDQIGEDPWSNSGFSAKNLKDALKDVPKNKELDIHVNSPGGDVHEGMAIKAILDAWPAKVNVYIDGVAASTASWMILGADKVYAAKMSQMFLHDALTWCFGNQADFIEAADDLDKVSNQIADVYAEKTGKSAKAMRDIMRNETLITGQEAMEMGLVDEIVETDPTYNFTTENLANMRNRLGSIKNSAASKKEQDKQTQNKKENDKIIMNREKMIALLNKWGVQIPKDATDEQLQNLIEKGPEKEAPKEAPKIDPNKIVDLEKEVEKLKNADTESRRTRLSNEIDKIIADDKIPAAQKEKALNRCIKDETYLDELKALPSRPVGAPNLESPVIEVASESFADIQKHVLENTVLFVKNFTGPKAGNEVGEKARKEIASRAVSAANTIRKYKDKLIQAWNTNNIDPNLQRQVILQQMLEAFKVKLLPLARFSTVFTNVPLEGNDKIEVPYYPLQAAASVSFNKANGYRTQDKVDTNIQYREVQVGGDGVTAAPANMARDRKWIGFAFSSAELRRQPYANWEKLAQQNANKLGVDIFSDIISRVITAANFGAAVKAVAAPLFTGDDIADLSEVGTGLYWPEVGRSLALNHTYRTPLLKDPTFKQYLSYGSTDPLRKAQIQEAYGFENIDIVANLANYSPANENLIGWICWMYAVLIATAPIMPTEEVRALLTRYDLATDPETGITLEYRRFGDVTLDQTTETVECSYGAAKGVDNALRRLASQ